MRFVPVLLAALGCTVATTPTKDSTSTSGEPPPSTVVTSTSTSTTPTDPLPTDTGDTATTGHTGDTGTATSTLPAPTVVERCDQPSADSWLSGVLDTPELHVFGVYEADGGHGGPPGTLTIDLVRPVDTWLVLSSYEPIDWTIVTQAGASVAGVIVNGYHDQTVTVTDSAGAVLAVPVDNRSPYTNGSFGFYAHSLAPGYYTDEVMQLVATAESETGLTATAFWGCYHSTGFQLQ